MRRRTPGSGRSSTQCAGDGAGVERRLPTAPGRTASKAGTGDVAVIGAGIVGAATTHALARAGAVVHLIDREAPGRGTSGACEGNLVLWDRSDEADLRLAQLGHRRWAELAAELEAGFGIDIEYDRKGSLMVLGDAGDVAGARVQCDWLARHGVRFEWVDAADVVTHEPSLLGPIAGAARFPEDAQIEPRRATHGLVRAAQRLGARVHTHEPVREIAADERRLVVRTPRRSLAVDRVVVAAGAWSPALLRPLGVELPIRARKGHIAVVMGAPMTVRHKVMEAGYFRTVASDAETLQIATVVESTRSGTLLLGSSRAVTDADDRGVEVDVIRRIATRALRYFPDLGAGRVIRSYAGLRPMAPDHRPLIGPLPDDPRVLVATGHEGGGIMESVATADLVSHLVAGTPAPLPVDPYLPIRLVPGREVTVGA